jgi:hypothetical protein
MTVARDSLRQELPTTGNRTRTQSGPDLERLAQFFPGGTRVKMPVEVSRLSSGSAEPVRTILEYGTAQEVIFRCAVPMEFGDRLRLTNRDGSLDAEAEVTAVQIGASEMLVAARFVAEVHNWIIK